MSACKQCSPKERHHSLNENEPILILQSGETCRLADPFLPCFDTGAALAMDEQTALVVNNTLYVHNLSLSLKKDFLIRNLYVLFSQFGPIIDLVAMKGERRRGQAFIVFKDLSSAIVAIRSVNGLHFFGREISIEFAKTRSKKFLEMEGTQSSLAPYESAAKRMKREEAAESPANRILYLENIPPNATPESITLLFQQQSGFKEVRTVPGNSSIAFVEFNSEPEASAAKDVMNLFKISPTHELRISFARK